MKTKISFIQMSILIAALLLSACASTSTPASAGSSRKELTDQARITLNALYESTPRAKELRKDAAAILVFPDILKAGFLIGGSGGNGVMFSPNGQVLGYYNATSLSYGLQAGAQSFSEAMFFMTRDSLKYLDSSSGWSIGAGPSVVVLDEGMARDLSSTTLRHDVYAFIYGQQGLMAGIGIQGQKITRLQP